MSNVIISMTDLFALASLAQIGIGYAQLESLRLYGSQDVFEKEQQLTTWIGEHLDVEAPEKVTIPQIPRMTEWDHQSTGEKTLVFKNLMDQIEKEHQKRNLS